MKAPAPRSHDEVDAALATSRWSRVADSIVLRRSFETFAAALGFVVSVGALAEAQNHHPDIELRWTAVQLTLSTHQIGGLSERDLTFAAAVDSLG